MGARVYLPQLGRFAQVDPIEGGTENNYVYPGDPVNEFDLSGKCVGFLLPLLPACVAGLTAAVSALGGAGGGAGAATGKAAQLARNAAQGRAAEQALAKELAKKYGQQNVKAQVYTKTPYGGRRSDFLVNNGRSNWFIEVKSGYSRYTKSQKQKDQWIKSNFGTPTYLKRVPRK
jgi:hypothetical protein